MTSNARLNGKATRPPLLTGSARGFSLLELMLGAMVLVAIVVIGLGFWVPATLYDLVQKSVCILGGTL